MALARVKEMKEKDRPGLELIENTITFAVLKN
jgi:hypothetical protein